MHYKLGFKISGWKHFSTEYATEVYKTRGEAQAERNKLKANGYICTFVKKYKGN